MVLHFAGNLKIECSNPATVSGQEEWEKWGKVGKSGEKWGKVGKSGEKWGKWSTNYFFERVCNFMILINLL